MFDELKDLYSAEIRQHGRHPSHARRPDGANAQARGDNPMCGDRVTVFLRRSADRVLDAGFEARGCEITVASADLMCALVPGHDAAHIRGMAEHVATLARTGHCPACDPSLTPLGAVHDYPSRLRCVTLPWQALVAALDGQETLP